MQATAYQMTIFGDEELVYRACAKQENAFSKLASSLESKLQKKLEQANAKCNTQRKVQFADAAYMEYQELALLHGYSLGLARLWGTNTLKGCLQTITKEHLLYLHRIKVAQLRNRPVNLEDIFKKLNYSEDRVLLRKMGVWGVDALTRVLNALDEVYTFPQESMELMEIKKLERALIGCDISGYFPTPEFVASYVVELAGLTVGMNVLEPSAGKGDLAMAIAQHPVTLDVIEYNYSLRSILEKKGFKVVADDFLEYTGKYDAIVMNPPFENAAYITHVRHAYACSLEGGRLVAILPREFDRKTSKQFKDFTSWLECKGVSVEDLPDNAFKESDRPTSVQTCVIVVDR